MRNKTAENPVDLAIEAAGGIRPLSRLLGISAPSVFEWRKRRCIPAERVIQVETATGVNRSDLRPDIYPREAAA